MEQRSLTITGANSNFFSKVSKTLTKIMAPTKEGINAILISNKRNNVIKTYENYKKVEENSSEEETLERKYEQAYTSYLEILDKYVLNSIYKKVSAGVATDFQKQALSQYYGIVQLKENEYNEYKYRKQKYLLELDNENVRIIGKEKLNKKYKAFYISKMDELYKKILKNYSIKLADNTNIYDSSKELIYTKVFITVEEYIKAILTLKIEDRKNEEIVEEYKKFEKFMVGKLDTRDNIEKNLILLGISRKLFTHSLPLVVAEQCYLKLLKDARTLVQDTKIAAKREKAYEMLINLIEDYNIKLLATKVYWEDERERENFKRIMEEYKNIEPLKETDFNEYMRKKETLLIKEEIRKIGREKIDYTQLLRYYKRKLVDYGELRGIKNKAITKFGKHIKKQVDKSNYTLKYSNM